MLNKYMGDKRLFVITFILFLILIILVDKNNLIEGWRLRREIKSLEREREYYLDRISEDSIVIKNLNDDRYLERLARELYLMKRPEEVIYIVNEK